MTNVASQRELKLVRGTTRNRFLGFCVAQTDAWMQQALWTGQAGSPFRHLSCWSPTVWKLQAGKRLPRLFQLLLLGLRCGFEAVLAQMPQRLFPPGRFVCRTRKCKDDELQDFTQKQQVFWRFCWSSCSTCRFNADARLQTYTAPEMWPTFCTSDRNETPETLPP